MKHCFASPRRALAALILCTLGALGIAAAQTSVVLYGLVDAFAGHQSG